MSAIAMAKDLRHRSHVLYDGPDRAPARSYLKAIGLTDADIAKPMVGIASTWTETMPCNFTLRALDVPGVVLYGGSIQPGVFRGKQVTVLNLFEAVGAHAAKKITDEDLHELEGAACPGPGACGGQFTANTMAMALEFMGLSPMGSASVAATDPGKEQVAADCGALVLDLLRRGVTPRAITTRAAFENAIAGVAASGGSTNAVLHLLALAREIGVPLTIDDFDRVSRRTPLLCDLKPGGRFTAVDLGNAGGGAVVGKRLVAAGLVDGSALTPSGRTFAE